MIIAEANILEYKITQKVIKRAIRIKLVGLTDDNQVDINDLVYLSEVINRAVSDGKLCDFKGTLDYRFEVEEVIDYDTQISRYKVRSAKEVDINDWYGQ